MNYHTRLYFKLRRKHKTLKSVKAFKTFSEQKCIYIANNLRLIVRERNGFREECSKQDLGVRYSYPGTGQIVLVRYSYPETGTDCVVTVQLPRNRYRLSWYSIVTVEQIKIVRVRYSYPGTGQIVLVRYSYPETGTDCVVSVQLPRNRYRLCWYSSYPGVGTDYDGTVQLPRNRYRLC